MAVLSGHNPARLDNGQFFLDTYLWWAYADRRQGGAESRCFRCSPTRSS